MDSNGPHGSCGRKSLHRQIFIVGYLKFVRRQHLHAEVELSTQLEQWQGNCVDGKFSFVNRTIRLWNRLPAEILGTLPCKTSAFRKRVRKVINVVN